MEKETEEAAIEPTGSGKRQSARENAGKPPDRFGSMVSFQKKANSRKNTPTATPSKPRSTQSKSSSASNSSTLQIRKAELEAKKKIAQITKDREDKERNIKNMEFDVNDLKNRIDGYNDIAWDQQNEEVMRTEAEVQSKICKQQLAQMEGDIVRAKSNLDFDERDFQRQEILINEEVEVLKLAVAEDSEKDEVNSQEDDSSHTSQVEKWAEKTVIHVPKDPTVLGEDKEASDKEDDDDGDVEKSSSEEEFPKKPSSHKKKKQRHTQKSKSASNQFSLEDIALVLADAIKGSNPSNNKVSEKILARQIQGKELPFFSGRPEEWPGFLAAFETSSKSCSYNNAENLPRLQKCLKGEALRSVQCLLVDPDGVPKVIEKLKMRFGRPALIIESMVRKLREVPAVKLDRSETFVDFGIAVDNLVSTIKSLKQPQHLGNPTLLQELVRKLPLMTQMDWIKSQQNDLSNLEDFATWFESYTQAACKLCPIKGEPEIQRSGRRDKKPEKVYAAREYHNNKSKTERKCVICFSSHHQRECPIFLKADVDERWKIVKEKRICYCCLNAGHRCQDCSSKRRCGENGCTSRHNKLLHHDKYPIQKTTEVNVENEVVLKSQLEAIMKASSRNEVIHMMSPIELEGPHGRVQGYAILDGLSSVTTMESATVQELGIVGSSVPLTIKGFNSTKTYQDSQLIDVKLRAQQEEYNCILKNVRTVDKIEHRQSVRRYDLSKWPHLKDLDIPTYDNAKPTILIGLDNPQIHVHLEYRMAKSGNAPVGVRTPLGWMVMGKLGSYQQQHTMFSMSEADTTLHKLVKDYFTIESMGISPSGAKPRSTEDMRAQSILDSTMRRVSTGWEVGLLWRDDKVQLPQSKQMALSRLKNMEKKMDRDSEFANQYEQKILEYQQKGFARKLTEAESQIETGKTFYLPHFMAFNPKKPKKYRFVFDAAAKVRGSSLNDFLLRGPDKLVSLPGILLKFRRFPIAISADIQDMFHRVRVKKEDAQAQRFLWRGMDRNRDPDIYEMGVLIFGATCSPTCAQEAKNRNALEFQQQYPSACETILTKHYVDDLLDSKQSPEEAIQLFKDVREVHNQGGFNLCNWLSNSKKVMESIPEELRSKSMKSLDFSSQNLIERVLGLFWRPDDDTFTFSLTFLKAQAEVMEGQRMPTKREVLSLVMSLYDPLGFLSILTVKAKIIIQKCWVSEVGWDCTIPEETGKYWNKWLEELQNITEFRLPRCYFPNLSSSQENQLHVFGDASQEAYGAVVYLRIKTAEGIHVSLITAKAKVAPIKIVSIPRLELQASLLGARLAKFVKEEIGVTIDRIFYWTDSSTVIDWIRADGKRFQQFVAHRIGEIQEVTDIKDWRWLPTNENVADEMTRINSLCDFTVKSRWIQGPDFLKKPEEEWPTEREKKYNSLVESEVKKALVLSMKEVIPIIDITRFSKWRRLINATAYIMRFAKRNKPESAAVGVEEFRNAEKWWWIQAQKESFPEEVVLLREERTIPKNSRLSRLTVALDEEGVMRVRGRIDNADVPFAMRSPVVLDARHPFTILLLRYYHEICGHHGHERIGNEVRQQYYIPSMRNAIRRTYANCQQCKNNKAKPHIPEMGQLPKFRVQKNVHPFHKTGLDYFGPVEVVVKRSRVKRYVALFTCLSTRAVHLEVAGALSTDSCIMAIRRFVCRRGCPETIHSDNGTNFHGANNELRAALKELDQDEMTKECSNKGIRWSYNAPSAPHFGGSWERLVRSVKVAMGSVLKMKNLSEEVLHTVLIEAEHTVNSHPLTHVADDPDDPEALTPNHFLIGRSSNLQPIGKFNCSDLFDRKQWRVSQHMADEFWRRWVKEFLPTLLRRQKWCEKSRPVQVGDVVIEINENLPRNSWPKGRVIKTFPGKDHLVRVVDIKLSNGHIYRRPVAKLCILDLQPSDKDEKTANI